MNILLDTHTLIWFIGGSTSLSTSARFLIEEPSNQKFVSIVSVWEIAMKVSIGKMTLLAPFEDLFPNQININGFELVPIKVSHASIVTALPFHNRDPFDRIIVAQAIEGKWSVVSVDKIFDKYGVTRLW